MSMLKMAVWAKTSMSPIQPSRSSRCGQSVGTLCMLSRCVQTMFCISWLSSGLEHSKLAGHRRRASGMPRPVRMSSGGLGGQAGHLDVAEAVVGEVRLEGLVAARREGELVLLAGPSSPPSGFIRRLSR